MRSVLGGRRAARAAAALESFLKLTVKRQMLLNRLASQGWHRSARLGHPVAADGQPLPWFTYPSIAFLEERVRREWFVFEFGAGSSTMWWAQRVDRVVSCEHDQGWYQRMVGMVPENVSLAHRKLDDGYVDEAARYLGTVDVLVIDGRRRNDCVERSLSALSSRGVIVWDNSERERYQQGKDLLVREGFRCVTFDGIGPVNPYAWQTSIYYRDGNCVGL